MNLQLEARKSVLSALIALAVLAGVCFLVSAPKASAVKSDCPSGKVCFWSGPTFGGTQAFFEGTGCKGLENIDPASAWNNTNNRTVTFSCCTIGLGPGGSYRERLPYGGTICIS